MLRNMPKLREIYWHGVSGGLGATPEELALAFSAPTLETLTIQDITVSSEAPTPTLPDFSALRTFRYCFTHRFREMMRIPLETLLAENAWMEVILGQLRHRLEYLVIPGESTRVSFLVREPWPNLRRLSICGECPLLDASLTLLLHAMPQLRRIALAVAQRTGAPPLLVWPAGENSGPDLHRLRHFTMSFPSADDGIFALLPDTLISLCLRDTPRYHYRRLAPARGEPQLAIYGAPLLACASALRIFRVLHTAQLRQLELVVRWENDSAGFALLNQIAITCPEVAFLELHCYRNIDDAQVLLRDQSTLPVVRGTQ